MIELIKTIFLTSITVLSFMVATSEGMLLKKLGKYAQEKAEEGSLMHELLVCPFCAPTLFTLPVFIAAYALGFISLSWKLLLLIPFNIFGSCIVSGFLWSAYIGFLSWKEKCEMETKHIENMERLSFWDVKDRKDSFQRANKKERSY